MAIGEDGRPHGVSGGGRRARGVNGGEGREDRPVPPMMAIGTGSGTVLAGCSIDSHGHAWRYLSMLSEYRP